jgi:hypothetical protein
MTAMHAADALNRSVARRLKATDRCDACGAQAYVEVAISTNSAEPATLMFCGHDYSKHESKLANLTVDIVDERYLLGVR